MSTSVIKIPKVGVQLLEWLVMLHLYVTVWLYRCGQTVAHTLVQGSMDTVLAPRNTCRKSSGAPKRTCCRQPVYQHHQARCRRGILGMPKKKKLPRSIFLERQRRSFHILSSWNAKEETSTFYLPGMPNKKLPHSVFLECQRRRSFHILSSWNAKEEKNSTFYLPGMPKKKLPCSTSTFCLPGMPKKKKLPQSIFLECQRKRSFLECQRRRWSFHTLSSWNTKEEASMFYLPVMPKKKLPHSIFLECQRSFHTLPGMPKKLPQSIFLECLSSWNAKEEASTLYLSGMPKKKLPHSIFLECQRRKNFHILSSWNAKEEASMFYIHILSSWNAKEDTAVP